MARFKEPLNGGLVTVNDPGQLEPGQLSDARNCMYLATPGTLQQSPGRVSFGTVTASAIDVVGLRDIQFDNGDQYLIAITSGAMTYAPVGDSGSFSVLTSGNGGNQLEAVQYADRFFLFNGAGSGTAISSASAVNLNDVLYLSATAAGTQLLRRQHGMAAVSASPATATANGVFSETVTGYYEYWTTEVARLTQDGAPVVLESTFAGTPTTTLVPSTAVVPTIYMPPIRNPITTNWRVYRSPAKQSATAVQFPDGFMIAELGTATGTVPDSAFGSLTASASALPRQVNNTSQFYSDMGSQATALTAIDGTYGSMAVPAGGGIRWQAGYDFNFSSFFGNVVGLAVEIKAFATGAGAGNVPVQVVVGSPRTNLNGDYGWFYKGNPLIQASLYHQGLQPVSKAAIVTATAAGQVVTVGGSADRWEPPNQIQFSPNDFLSGNSGFMVVLYFSTPNAALFVDYIRATVYYGVAQDSTIQFPQVVYTFGDVTAQVGKHGPPPSSSTGDMFQDQLVLNDVGNPSVVRYSYPSFPESFPATYYIDFQTRENDIVRAIKTVNNRLMVWLDASTWRVNYLPSERDASFDRGKAIEPVSTTFGSVNPMCVCTFTMAGYPEMAAFVSDQGIHASDGFNLITLSDMLNWRTILATANSTPIALLNDRERRQLLFYFRNDSYANNETYFCLPFCYHEAEIGIGGHPKPGGLIHMRNFDVGSSNTAELKSAWAAPRSRGDVSVYMGYGGSTAAGAGQVYIEKGNLSPARDPRMQYTTRRIYAADYGGEWEVGEVYGYVASGYTNGTQVQYQILKTKTNDQGEIAGTIKTAVLSGAPLHKVTFREMVEGARISFVASATGYSAGFLMVDGTGFGLEDSGR